MHKEILLVFLLVLSSCQGVEKTENRIQIDLDKSIKGKFSDVFESIDYMVLENPDDSPLVWPYTVKYHAGNFWMRDITNNMIFKYSRNGGIIGVIRPL
jgi:hypothetical protein